MKSIRLENASMFHQVKRKCSVKIGTRPKMDFYESTPLHGIS